MDDNQITINEIQITSEVITIQENPNVVIPDRTVTPPLNTEEERLEESLNCLTNTYFCSTSFKEKVSSIPQFIAFMFWYQIYFLYHRDSDGRRYYLNRTMYQLSSCGLGYLVFYFILSIVFIGLLFLSSLWQEWNVIM